jgi:hypothetical protein
MKVSNSKIQKCSINVMYGGLNHIKKKFGLYFHWVKIRAFYYVAVVF